MNTLQDLMNEGWNINVECKARGRTYGMTYEASMYNLHHENFSHIHATGNSLTELALNLIDRITVTTYHDRMISKQHSLDCDKPL